MKLFKKLLAVAMVAVLALTVLTGCDTGTTDPRCCLPSNAMRQKVLYYASEQWCGKRLNQRRQLSLLSCRKDLTAMIYQKLNLLDSIT